MTTLERASEAAPRPELDWERNWQGRPRILPDPAWDDVTRGKWQAGRANDDGSVDYTRVTTFAEALQDSSALTRWKMRRAVLGMGRRPDYVTAAAALTAEDRDRAALDDLAEKALEAAGPNAAEVGTALHGFTERLDRGEELGPVPAEYEATLAAYTVAVRHLTFVEFECRTVCDELEVAGTPDRVGFCDIPDPDGEVDPLRIIDTKTGRVDYSAGKFSTQLAIYRRSHLYHPGTGARTSWEDRHGKPVSRWGIVVHVPAGAGTAELLWLNLDHGWTGAELALQVRSWRTGATAGALLQPVFARPPRAATADGTCRGRKQDGQPCGYRRKAREPEEFGQFCGRHQDQAHHLRRWLAENPDTDPAAGVEELPSAKPVQPSSPPVPPATANVSREEASAAAERNVDAVLGVTRPDPEAQPDDVDASGPDGGADDCPWCQNTGCSVCQPDRPVLEESSRDVAAQAFAGAQAAVAARELPTVGTYALDPAAEVNGNPRPVSGLQTPEDADWARAQARRAVLQQLEQAQTKDELVRIYLQADGPQLWTAELGQVADMRLQVIRQREQLQRPQAALLAALENAPDTDTLTRLWSQYPRELWTAEAQMLAQRRWTELTAQ